MNSFTTPGRRRRAALVGIALVAGLAPVLGRGASAAAPSYAPPACPTSGFSFIAGQPVDGGVLKVARVSGKQAGWADKWDLKLDAWVCNMGSAAINHGSAKVEFLDSAGAVHKSLTTTLYGPRTENGSLTSFYAGAGDGPVAAYIRPAESNGAATLFDTPLPASVRFTITFRNTSGAAAAIVTRTYPVAEQVSPGPLGGFFFPLRQSGLPAGARYFQGYHEDFNSHNRYALDIGATRFDATASKWTQYKADTATVTWDHTKPDSWLMWNVPVYAMSDGEVISCVRGAPDNDPTIVDGEWADPKPAQVAKYPGGNYLWVRTGTQTQVYAHLKQNSIPESLCPHSDNEEHTLADPFVERTGDVPYRIKAGQFLGRIGNSGNTSNPHTHVESIMGTSIIWGGWHAEYGYGSDSRPMRFVNVKVQPLVADANEIDYGWLELKTPMVLPYQTLISPNGCNEDPSLAKGKAEVVKVSTSGTCWAQMSNAMRQAGFRPVHYDSRPNSTTVRITSVWRPADGTSWAMFHGLDATGLKSKQDAYFAAGYRYLQLEGYTENGAPRYAAIFVKQPGATQYSRVGMSPSTFSSVFTTQSNAGYRLVDLSVAVVSGAKQYTGLWVKANVGSYVVKDVSVAGFKALFDSETQAGRKLQSMNSYRLGTTPYLTTVWYSSLNSGWTVNYEQTAAGIGSLETSNLSAGRYARSVTEYLGSTTRLAGLWRAAPNSAVTSGPASSTTATTATLTFRSDDALATFECRLDAGAWAACSSARSYSGLAKGSHTFAVRARDFQGLRDASPATRSWTVS